MARHVTSKLDSPSIQTLIFESNPKLSSKYQTINHSQWKIYFTRIKSIIKSSSSVSTIYCTLVVQSRRLAKRQKTGKGELAKLLERGTPMPKSMGNSWRRKWKVKK
jgi:hypothetical protein